MDRLLRQKLDAIARDRRSGAAELALRAVTDLQSWLRRHPKPTEQELLALLRPCPDDWLKIWPVDNKVGNVRNTGRELMLPLEEPLL